MGDSRAAESVAGMAGAGRLDGVLSGAMQGAPDGVTAVMLVAPVGPLSLAGVVNLSLVAGEYGCLVRVGQGPQTADARDIPGVLSLGIEAGMVITVEAEGERAVEAASRISRLISDNFGLEGGTLGMKAVVNPGGAWDGRRKEAK